MNERTRQGSAWAYIIPFILIPAVIALGVIFTPPKWHILISFAVAVLSVALFLLRFEKNFSRSGRLVLAAIFTALAVVGRFIPVFKPVCAITILAAIHLGGEAGFLIGSMTALISDFYFGQGPWTAFQMLAWGLIGLFAGFLAGPLKKNKVLLILYGVVSGVFFSLLMDVWTVLWYRAGFELKLYLSAILSALPFTALYAVSNALFLLLLSGPVSKKLERVMIKYRL